VKTGLFSINRPLPPLILALLSLPPRGLTTKFSAKAVSQINLSLSKVKAFMIKVFSSKREERRLKTPSEVNKHINVTSTLKINTPS